MMTLDAGFGLMSRFCLNDSSENLGEEPVNPKTLIIVTFIIVLSFKFSIHHGKAYL